MEPTDTTSASLLQRLQAHNAEDAWSRFADLYVPLIHFWVRKVGLQASDADDVVQDVFTVLVSKMPSFQFDRGKSFRGWLRTVTLNKCRDFFRHRQAVPDHAGEAVAEIDVPDDIELYLEDEYRQMLSPRALQLMRTEFEETTWKACWESVVSRRPGAEIAKGLGITTNAVYLAKSRVLRRLREEFEGLIE